MLGVAAGVLNASKIVGKKLTSLKVVINGAGAAGIGTAEMLRKLGVRNIIVCDRFGALTPYRPESMHWAKWELAKKTNPDRVHGSLDHVIRGADVFIGFSVGDVVTPEMVRSMAPDPIIFAFAGPVPEIEPAAARAAGAVVVATAQSNHPNQMDIASVFPGLFRGLLDVRAMEINDEMLVAAARALADVVTYDKLNPDYIVPKVLDYRVAPAIAEAVARAAIETGAAKVATDPVEIGERTRRYVNDGHFPVGPVHRRTRRILRGRSRSTCIAATRARWRSRARCRSRTTTSSRSSISRRVPSSRRARSPRIPSGSTTTPSSGISWRSSPTARPSSASATSAPRAAMPVMEGKAVLFHTFGGVEAFPICLTTQDQDEIVEIVKRLEPDVRRRQPRGHLRAALLLHRGAAAEGDRHPDLP